MAIQDKQIPPSALHLLYEIEENGKAEHNNTLRSTGLQKILDLLPDLWFVKIRGLHKHDYQRAKDANAHGFVFEQYECNSCGRTAGLDAWQIRAIPLTMKYVPINSLPEDSQIKLMNLQQTKYSLKQRISKHFVRN